MVVASADNLTNIPNTPKIAKYSEKVLAVFGGWGIIVILYQVGIKMKLAPYQDSKLIYLLVTIDDINKLPKADYTIDFQDGNFCLEFIRSIPNLIGLQLCGVKIDTVFS